ncbi:hypothetical protein FO519_005613 [Halicephalobus sp. NKZ332]|nr:hypothetical protein FO519_005613 [Halicephalobus sp. NKZ332]
MPCTVEAIRDIGDDGGLELSSSSASDQGITFNLPESNGSIKSSADTFYSNCVPRNQSRSIGNAANGKTFNEIDPLPGEKLEKYDDVLSDCDLYFSIYRIVLVLKNKEGFAIVPTLDLDTVEARDVCLQLNCKDGRIIRLKATTNEAACALYKKLTQISTGKRELFKDIYAYNFRQEVAHTQKPHWIKAGAGEIKDASRESNELKKEFDYLGYDSKKWRITEANDQFKLCRTYPQYLVVPSGVSDEDLHRVHNGRFFSRFPVAVWRCKPSGAVLLRSAQPTISWLGAANEDDLRYIDTIYNSVPSSSGERKQKLLILDARSYTAAWANRAKGGGFEGSDTYVNCDIEFMSLPNIHNVRYSFSQLRNVAHSTDDTTFLTNLHNSQWFHCIGTLIRTAMRCTEALLSGRSVLVHCSDGWDRTAQIVALCKVMSDPYYRTFEGFKYIVQRDWVGFGHKFADRNGVLNEDPNERSPIFLQWLDCVHQLWHQNPREFQFNQRYLMKLAQHSYSGLFGTFLFNSVADASAYSVQTGRDNYDADSVSIDAVELFTVWDYLNEENKQFVNVSHNPKRSVLKCKAGIPFFRLWSEVYRCTEFETAINSIVDENCSTPNITPSGQVDPDRISNISRSQSVSSLVSASDVHGTNHTAPSYPAPIHSISSGSPHCGFTNHVSRVSQDAQSDSNWKDNIDVDGLDKVSIEPEDSVLSLVFRLQKQNEHELTKRTNSMNLDTQLVDDFVSVTTVKPATNGVAYNGTQKPRINGFSTSNENGSTCAEAENVPTRSGERISVK